MTLNTLNLVKRHIEHNETEGIMLRDERQAVKQKFSLQRFRLCANLRLELIISITSLKISFTDEESVNGIGMHEKVVYLLLYN